MMSSCILIENLLPRTDVSKLCEMFGKFGRILSANIETDSQLVSLCKGCICYDTPHSAHYAVKEMNGRKVSGKQIFVKYKKNFDHPVVSSQSDYYKKIFVKNMDSSWDDYNLIGYFERFGEIENAKVSETDGESNGYGFVKYKEHSSAKMAVEAMHNKVIDGSKLIVQPFIYKDKNKAATNSEEKSIQPNNLFIKHLPKDMDENELRDLFKKCGSISSIKIATDYTRKSKGYGFVCFHDKADAAKAQNQINGLRYRSAILEVDFYKKKLDYDPVHSKVVEDKVMNIFSSTNKKTVFSFSAKG